MYIRLRDLAEYHKDSDYLRLHLRGSDLRRGHHVQERRGKRVKQPLPNEHAAEVVLRGRTLQLEDTSNPVQRVLDEVRLFRVILVEEFDKDLEAAATEQDFLFV